jgi:hypothetical protein
LAKQDKGEIVGRKGETFSAHHSGNESKDSKCWFLSTVFTLSELGAYMGHII